MLQNKKRIETLQILRAIAFLEIFLGHCGIKFFTGSFGVSIFIVLSGFCMALNYLPKAEQISLSPISNVKFALLKIKRLYGLHIVMLIATFILVKMPTSKEAIRRLWLNIFLVQSFTTHSEDYFSYNGVAWYLSTYLFICIFALYIIKLLSKCKDKKKMLIFGAILYAIMIIAGTYLNKNPVAIGDNFARWFTYIFPGYRLLDFTLGAMLGWLYLNYDSRRNVGIFQGTFVECFAAAMFIVTILIFHKMDGIKDGICHTALFAPISLLLVSVFTECRGLLTKLLNNPLLLWIGNLSTYTFLIHQVIIRWLRFVLKGHFTDGWYRVILTILSFVITTGLAQLVKCIGDGRKKQIKN